MIKISIDNQRITYMRHFLSYMRHSKCHKILDLLANKNAIVKIQEQSAKKLFKFTTN